MVDNMIMFKKWLKAAGVRALKTVAQAAIAFIGVSKAMGDVNWLQCGSAVLLAGILSLLTSVAGLPEVEAPKIEDEIDDFSEDE